MISSARAQASRQNGARSRGPKTAVGKARASRNALKHGLRARKAALLDDENPMDFATFHAAVRAELAPAGTFQADLVSRIVMAAWRARRADRLEAALLGRHLAAALDPAYGGTQDALGAGLIRDGNGPRALETLVRYRGSAFGERFRSFAVLKALQAEANGIADPGLALLGKPNQPDTVEKPNQPEAAEKPNEPGMVVRPDGPGMVVRPDGPGTARRHRTSHAGLQRSGPVPMSRSSRS